MSQPPMQASNSRNGRSGVEAPRRGDSYGQVSIAESVRLSQGPPASRTITSAPAWVRVYAAMPPPAPEPTMQTSKTLDCVGGGEWRVGMAGKKAVGSAGRVAPPGGPEDPGPAAGVGFTRPRAAGRFRR